MSIWPRLRRITQIGAFLGFLALLLLTRGAQFPELPPSLFFRLDPLAPLAASVAGREWIGGLALGLVTVGLTLAAGRVWCGWICPLGTVLEWCRFPGGAAAGRKVSLIPALKGRAKLSPTLQGGDWNTRSYSQSASGWG